MQYWANVVLKESINSTLLIELFNYFITIMNFILIIRILTVALYRALFMIFFYLLKEVYCWTSVDIQ